MLPVYNEQQNLPVMWARLRPILSQLSSYEVIFVDDGSTDHSADIMDALHRENSSIKVITLSRNFGHQAALTAGLDYAGGRAVVMFCSR